MQLTDALHPLTGAVEDYDPLVQRAAQCRFALLGEASHGTHEFYAERAAITKRLITEAGYRAVAVEADWPDAHRLNRFVRAQSDDRTAGEALQDFRRFPVWMWRNTEVADFAGWLRDFNDALAPGEPKVGFYGLDLYSLHRSMEATIDYLEQVDPEAAARARERYSCFDHFGADPQVYAYEAGIGGAEPCERQAVEQLVELQRSQPGDDPFFAEQNASLVVDAERYYRAMFRGRVESWNLRDRHMARTLDALAHHLGGGGGDGEPGRIAVWAHNSHLGDARATEMGAGGELNVGQLVRERHRGDALLVGMTTREGTVTAASDWGGIAERKRVREALPGSWESSFHDAGAERILVDPGGLEGERLERAIGVIYRPETERMSHYFHARLAAQFDAVLHIDRTRALEPLELTSEWERGELPETYPWGV
ncbi:MAG: hypothetical protein QOJ97_516 [Solirubrobacteraceae bacterium]|nr:hypothetical protein [Solirubrobacteraceae bacterium]